MFWNKKKEQKSPVIHTVYQNQLKFVDVDNVEHNGPIYNYFDPETITCSMGEYLLIDIKEKGFIKDKTTREIYPLCQIKKFWFETINSANIYPTRDEFIGFSEMWYTAEEVAEREVKK